MEEFEGRLEKAVARYRDLRAPEGGWGEDRWSDAPASIVNTVEVLAVLRAADASYSDPVVGDAMSYLMRAVKTHPQPVKSKSQEARGRFSRYYAWGLCGLTLYPASRHDGALTEAQSYCVDWLGKHEWGKKGAWGEQTRSEHPSLLSTSAAITGLTRLCIHHPSAKKAGELVDRARGSVRGLATNGYAGKSQRTSWWPMVAGGTKASPSATAMAVLVLADGGQDDRNLAREGARWLLSHVARWQSTIENDSLAPATNWQHMTFSLALRAILRSGVELPGNGVLDRTFSHMDELWSETNMEWSHGTVGARPSPSGSYAVVMAYQALARVAARHQPQAATPPRNASDEPKPVGIHVNVSAPQWLTIEDVDGSKITVTLQQAHHRMVRLLAIRHQEGAKEKTAHARSWDTAELAEALNVQHGTIERYVRLINRLVRSEAGPERGMGELLQFVAPNRRLMINVDRVTVDNE